jgi:tetraacyldisaccharide 4'-kinase
MEAQFSRLISGSDMRLAARMARPILASAAAPYGLVVAARNRLYDAGVLPSRRVDVTVVSIGNLTLGGTGKTPFVEFVCRWFLARGKRPVILSRGYRGVAGVESSSPQPMVVGAPNCQGLADSTPATRGRQCNDEALLLRANLPEVPHLQGKDRVALARQAIKELLPDVLVLDDGFQHRRLARDLDIVLVDCTQPFGYGRLFPRGLLREPIRSLRRADLVVLSRANLCTAADRDWIREQVATAAGEIPIVLAEHLPTAVRSGDGQSLPVSSLAGRSVAAFCGIGNPEAFWRTLTGLGCHLAGCRAFPDHHAYSAADLATLGTWAAELKPDIVVTTQKDFVKIPVTELGQRPLLALQIEASVHDPAGHLDRALVRALAARPPTTQAA